MLFDSWSGIGRVLLVGTLAYVALVALLRISGKRTLSKMNAFDLVVTVALGSTLATVLLSKSVALAEGLAAFAVLILLQYLVARLSVRSRAFSALVKSEPRLLLSDGRYLEGAMREERVVQEEVLAAIRSSGFSDPGEVAAVVLETDGSFSVIGGGSGGRERAIRNLDTGPSERA
ncbi:DUF421 domain-containing protein [Propylenella binzhouense]|uniref:DUF421 domain-containing protein n=1 Tax=Propylenella binzhouense TaxID=2555902 RepID=A0A964WU91_9HYPH|nr:YetF domain-containing protein [Propylenella binzhouense]MYZ48798.1 DUF421 domain-containing protein [Propylenella binzhouense]